MSKSQEQLELTFSSPSSPSKKTATTPKKATKTNEASPLKRKKELTEAQKARKEKEKARQEKVELKKKALFTEPKTLPSTAWRVYMTHNHRAPQVLVPWARGCPQRPMNSEDCRTRRKR